MQKQRFSYFDCWQVFYAVCIVLIPPVNIAGKTIFAAEWGLVPVVILWFWNLVRIQTPRPPRELVMVWIALLLAFISGVWRGDLARLITEYPLASDSFSLSQDGIRFLRWMLIFSLPWIIGSAALKVKTRGWIVFYETLFWLGGFSAALGLVDHFHFIQLSTIYGYHDVGNLWQGRIFATFQAPLEASVFFGCLFTQGVLSVGNNKGVHKYARILVLLVLGISLIFTQGATATFAVLISLILFSLVRSSVWTRIFVVATCFIVPISIYLLIPDHLKPAKIGNVIARTRIWENWFGQGVQHPVLFVSGMGFTGLVADSSLILCFFMGGALLFMAVGIWSGKLARYLPKDLWPFYTCWFLTWLTLDSIGYWGIGRAAWALAGLAIVVPNSNSRLKKQGQN